MRRGCYIAYDPQEDTETDTLSFACLDPKGSYIAYDPQEDTETDDGVAGAALMAELHRLRSARGY
mgnify:CR=1 FL=1